MKTQVLKTLSAVLWTLTATLFTSCDLLDKASAVNFDATLDETVNVVEETEGTDVGYSETIVLDATSNSDISKYKSKIEGFTVNKITYQVVSYDGPATGTFSGALSFGDASLSTSTVSAVVTNLDLLAAYNSGQKFQLLVNAGDVAKIETLLKDDKAVKLYLDGTLSETPLTCSVKVIMDVSVKATAL